MVLCVCVICWVVLIVCVCIAHSKGRCSNMYVHVCSDVSCHHYAYAYHPCDKSGEIITFTVATRASPKLES